MSNIKFLCSALLMCFVFSGFSQQEIYSSHEDSSHQRKIKGLRQPQVVNEEMHRIISDFVKKESLRFKMALHPAFANLDSLYPDQQQRQQIEQNPYALLAPILRLYRYEPVFSVENMPEWHDDLYCRNVFIVHKYDRFIRPENPALEITADTIWRFATNNFFDHDDLFSVYYCPPTGDLRMLGGNAFLQQLPEDAYPWDQEHGFDQDATIMARTRLINHGIYGGYHFHWVYFKRDTVRKNLFETEKYRYYSIAKTYNRIFGPGSCKLISVPMCRFYSITLSGPSHTSVRTPPVIVEPEEWDKFEIVYFTNQPNQRWTYEKGFPCYEIKWVVYNTPKRYEDMFPQVRGVSAEELKNLQADPEWLHYIFMY